MKPQAPLEVRGEFRSIPTAIPGFQINELMPQMARSARDFSFLRSLVGADNRHDAFQCQSGFSAKDLQNIGGRPAMGCVLNQRFSGHADVPTFVDMMQGRPLVRNSARPGFLGPAYQPFRPDISQMFSRPLVIAISVGCLYGFPLLTGVLPRISNPEHLSWDGHLCGAIAGVVVAYFLERRNVGRLSKQKIPAK